MYLVVLINYKSKAKYTSQDINKSKDNYCKDSKAKVFSLFVFKIENILGIQDVQRQFHE